LAGSQDERGERQWKVLQVRPHRHIIIPRWGLEEAMESAEASISYIAELPYEGAERQGTPSCGTVKDLLNSWRRGLKGNGRHFK
jgi:hypothetical protein